MPEKGKGLISARGSLHLPTGLRQDLLVQLHCVRIVVHDEDADTRKRRGGCGRGGFCRSRRAGFDRSVADIGEHEREPYHEGRPQPSARAFREDATAMELHEAANEREAEAEAPVLPRARAVALAKSIEDVREQIGSDALSGVAHQDLDVRVDALE